VPTLAAADGRVDLIASLERFDGRRESGRFVSHEGGLSFVSNRAGWQDLGTWDWLTEIEFQWSKRKTTEITLRSRGGVVGRFTVEQQGFGTTDHAALILAASGQIVVRLEGDEVDPADAAEELASPHDAFDEDG
jgi:hypothetical protein